MTVTASHASYDLGNFQSLLGDVLAEAQEKMTDSLRAEIQRAVQVDQESCFIRRWQLSFAGQCQGQEFTIGELCDSYVNERTAQVILPTSVRSILLGREGLIRRAGGGRCNKLLQDIQVGYVRDIARGKTEGPIIIGGRNRVEAIQVFLHTAMPEADLRPIKVRCLAYSFSTRDELEDAIVAANSGRDFPRSEKREKAAARLQLDLTSKEGIIESFRLMDKPNQSCQPTVVGAWLKLHAAELNLNGLTGAQVSDAGANLYHRLSKTVKPDGMTVGKWFKTDSTRLVRLCEVLEPALERAMAEAHSDAAAGPVAPKLGARLLPTALRIFPAI